MTYNYIENTLKLASYTKIDFNCNILYLFKLTFYGKIKFTRGYYAYRNKFKLEKQQYIICSIMKEKQNVLIRF